MTIARILLLTLIACAVGAIAPPAAGAGTYKATQCHPRTGAGSEDASYSSTSDDYRRAIDCAGSGLGITRRSTASRTGSGRHASWTVSAPAGAVILGASARVRGVRQASHRPELWLGLDGGGSKRLDLPHGRYHTMRWSGTAGRSLRATLACRRASGCGPGLDAAIHMRKVAFKLSDETSPGLELSGSLLEPGSRRGRQSLEVSASDNGSGVRQITVEVNGDPVAARVLDCAVARRVATRTRPCPREAAPRFELPTDGAFEQGRNSVRVCAADWAPRSSGNRRCETRSVRVDNVCPVSEVAGTRLRARIEGRAKRAATTSEREARVSGILRGPGGDPVRDATACIAAQPGSPGLPERVIGTPRTGADGRFRARVPAGPSRDVRVAHWPDADRALEEHLTLRSRAIPRLRMKPRGPIRNGSRARFWISIPGPANERRRVAVEAKANGRWIRIAGGRTSRRGRWRGSYRFRATTSTRRYSFRAFVPRQRGYPYEAGRSRPRRITVTG